jgi:hypothetical protein
MARQPRKTAHYFPKSNPPIRPVPKSGKMAPTTGPRAESSSKFPARGKENPVTGPNAVAKSGGKIPGTSH